MEQDEAIRYLVAGVQSILDGTAEVVGDTLRLPSDTIDGNDGKAVRIDTETEPGTIIYSLVPYPAPPTGCSCPGGDACGGFGPCGTA